MTGKDSQDKSKPDNKPKEEIIEEKPKETKSKKPVIPIEKVYRRRHLGKEKLSWITQDGIHHGFESEKIYGKIKGEGEEYVEDRSIVIGQTKDFTIAYSESKAKEIMEIAFETCPNPKFYFVELPEKYGFRNPQANFLGKFDEILTKFRDSKTL